jgi:hypothetical protein
MYVNLLNVFGPREAQRRGGDVLLLITFSFGVVPLCSLVVKVIRFRRNKLPLSSGYINILISLHSDSSALNLVTVGSSEILFPFYQTALDHFPENIKYRSSILNTVFLFIYNKGDKIDCVYFKRVSFRSDRFICILSGTALLLLDYFYDAFSVKTCIGSNGRMNDELKRIWKEAVMG